MFPKYVKRECGDYNNLIFSLKSIVFFQSLITLILENNQIEDEGAKYLANGLENNKASLIFTFYFDIIILNRH